MPSRKTELSKGVKFHVYNRGVDKRPVFVDLNDVKRFYSSIREFNDSSVFGGLLRSNLDKNKDRVKNQLVEINAYCLNPNHYHFILEPLVENGIEKFMQRLGNGYTKFFNKKYDRVGSLFQGPFKASLISTEDRFLELSAYVNLNYKIHQLRHRMSQLVKSSWGEYMGEISKEKCICNTGQVLKNFKSKNDYRKFAEKTIKEIIKKRKEDKELDKLLID